MSITEDTAKSISRKPIPKRVVEATRPDKPPPSARDSSGLRSACYEGTISHQYKTKMVNLESPQDPRLASATERHGG